MTPEWTAEYDRGLWGRWYVTLRCHGYLVGVGSANSVQEAVEIILDGLRCEILDAIEPQLAEQAHYEAIEEEEADDTGG